MAANYIDEYIGQRLRVGRNLRGVSQMKLAEDSDVSFQQIQKYELGKNRISASRLFEFARILEFPITYFYEGLFDGKQRDLISDTQSLLQNSKDNLRVIQAYSQIADSNAKRLVSEMMKLLAKT